MELINAGLLLYTFHGFRWKFSISLLGDISAGTGVSVGLSQNLALLQVILRYVYTKIKHLQLALRPSQAEL